MAFRKVLLRSKVVELESLLSLLCNVFLCRRKIDSQIWKPCPSGGFSSRALSRALDKVPNDKPACSLVGWVRPLPEWRLFVGLQ